MYKDKDLVCVVYNVKNIFCECVVIDGDGSRDILDTLPTEFSTVLTTILPIFSHNTN